MGTTFNPLLLMGFDKTGSSGGGGGGTIGGTVTGGTDKSVLFVDGTTLGQDPTDFNYDKTTNTLSVAGQVLTASIDRATSGTLSIGTTVNSAIINIGNSGATVNIQGTTLYENVTQLQVTDPLITLNKGGGVGSAQDSGIELEENSIITGYAKTSLDRNSWLLKAPNTAGDVTLTPGAGGITINQSSHDPVTLTAVGSSPNANGASLSSQALTLQPADGTNPGLLTAGVQTIGGNKTFTGSISASNISGTNTGDVTIGTANGLSIVGQVLSMALANGSVTGTLSATDYNTFNNKVSGPGSATDNAITRFDGTTGKLIQNSSASIDDSGNLTATNFSGSSSGTNSGDVTLATFGSSPNSSAASLSGQVLTLQPADATNPGGVSTASQSFSGLKTFLNDIALRDTSAAFDVSIIPTSSPILSASRTLTIDVSNANRTIDLAGNLTVSADATISGTNTGDVTLTAFGSTPNANGASLSGQALTLQPADSTNPGGVSTGTQSFAGNKTFIGSLRTNTSLIIEDPGAGTNTITIQAPTLAGSYTLTMPTDDGSASQFLQTDGSGVLSWQTVSSGSAGDITETSFTAADNQSSAANITGFAFSNAVVRSFEALVSIVRNTTYAVYQLRAIQKAASWEMSQDFTGDTTGITFSITTAGQVQYQSSSTGFTSLIKFRAITTSVA